MRKYYTSDLIGKVSIKTVKQDLEPYCFWEVSQVTRIGKGVCVLILVMIMVASIRMRITNGPKGIGHHKRLKLL